MPKFEVEAGMPERPLVVLPGQGVLTTGYPTAIFVQIGKAVAGCVICRLPIPVGSSRISIQVGAPLVEAEEQKRKTQKYHMHPGCLTKAMGSEVQRRGRDCWDCGIDGESAKDGGGWRHVFTTHRFIYSVLCRRCQAKPKWRGCGNCGVVYPQHMIQSGYIDKTARRELYDDQPLQVEGLWCPFCADRWGVITQDHVAESAEDFEETRRRIVERGVFDD